MQAAGKFQQYFTMPRARRGRAHGRPTPIRRRQPSRNQANVTMAGNSPPAVASLATTAPASVNVGISSTPSTTNTVPLVVRPRPSQSATVSQVAGNNTSSSASVTAPVLQDVGLAQAPPAREVTAQEPGRSVVNNVQVMGSAYSSQSVAPVSVVWANNSITLPVQMSSSIQSGSQLFVTSVQSSSNNSVSGPSLVGFPNIAPQLVGSADAASILNQSQHTPVRQLGAPLGRFVPLPIKEKIWKGEFVELDLLLTADDSDWNKTPMSFVQIGQTVCLKPASSRSKLITNIDRWLSAFFVYMSIFLQKFPGRAIELIKYADLIRKLARRFQGLGWAYYDREFRLGQALEPSRSWAMYDSDLFLEKMSMPSFNSRQVPFRGQNQFVQAASVPNSSARGVCYAFNRGNCSRQGCRFWHRCSKCSSDAHNAKACRSSSSNQSGSGTATTNSSGQAFKQSRNGSFTFPSSNTN